MKAYLAIACLIAGIIMSVSCSKSPQQNVVDVTARDFKFEVADPIPSGWTTFRFHNTGKVEHFFYLTLLPDSISFDRYHNGVTKPFVEVFDSLKAGVSKNAAIGLLGKRLPSWYFSAVKVMGGPGIIKPGGVAQTTVKLVPGTYAMECYIKTNGVFHSALGMIRPLTVSENSTDAQPPEPNAKITLSNGTIATSGEVKSGKNIFAVHYKEQRQAGLGNDVHLIRLSDNTDLNEVGAWMDWMNVKGLQSPAPAEFLGGAQEMPVGSTAYFTVDLTPGDYAFVAEPYAEQGMIKRFSVAD